MTIAITIGDEVHEYEPSKVNGLDAWEVHATLGADLPALLLELAALVDEGRPPPFHLAVVGKWLSVRQSGDPLASFAKVAAATTIFGED